MRPSVGRIVHYTPARQYADSHWVNGVLADPPIWAALITSAHEDGTVCLYVTPPLCRSSTCADVEEPFSVDDVGFTELKAGSHEARGKWAWPERVQ